MIGLMRTKEGLAAEGRLDRLLDERGLVVAGYAIIVAFVALFFIWGSLVPLASAAIAPGTVGVVGDKKRVQHPIGGVIDAIRVTDGDLVAAGDELIVLDAVEARSRNDELQARWIERTAERLRHDAALAGDAALQLPTLLVDHPLADRIRVALAHQQTLLDAQNDLQDSSRSRLQRTLDTIVAEVRTSDVRRRQLDDRLALIDAELDEYRTLAADGMVTRVQLFELEKDRDDTLGERETEHAEIEVAARRRAAILAEMIELDTAARNMAALGADEARRDADGLAQQRLSTLAELERKTIRAPIAGTVTASIATTLGGVIRAGEPIMEIVPLDERLLVESWLDPKDRDAIRIGQSASVRLTAFDRRSSRPVNGTVVMISADRLVDPTTAAPYFRTLVALDDTGAVAIVPGMQAEVLIATGEQTLLDYLLAPVTRSFDRALRED